MKKNKLYEIMLIIIGLLTYSIGTCMYLIKAWELKESGKVLSILGIIIIAIFIIIHNKNKTKTIKKYEEKDKIFKLVGFIGSLLFAIGMVVMFATKLFFLGVILSVSGFLIIVLNYPIYNYQNTKMVIKKIIKSEKTYRNILNFAGANLFALGLAMTAFEKWNLVLPGTIIGIVGVSILIFGFYLNSKKEKKKEYYIIDLRDVISAFVGTIGAFLISFGLIKLTSLTNRNDLIIGILFNYIGGLLCCFNLPINMYLKSNKLYEKTFTINIKDKNHIYSVRNLWLMFVIYGFLGWGVEFIVCGAYRGEFINRGFLHITLLPVWGLGGTIVTIIFSKSQRLVFTKSLVYLSLLEYVTSILLEYIFHNKWWDYTNNPFNLNGRICLFNSLAFGVFGFIFSKYVSPLINDKLNKFNSKKINYIAIFTLVVFIIDSLISFFYPNVGTGITS